MGGAFFMSRKPVTIAVEYVCCRHCSNGHAAWQDTDREARDRTVMYPGSSYGKAHTRIKDDEHQTLLES